MGEDRTLRLDLDLVRRAYLCDIQGRQLRFDCNSEIAAFFRLLGLARHSGFLLGRKFDDARLFGLIRS